MVFEGFKGGQGALRAHFGALRDTWATGGGLQGGEPVLDDQMNGYLDEWMNGYLDDRMIRSIGRIEGLEAWKPCSHSRGAPRGGRRII